MGRIIRLFPLLLCWTAGLGCARSSAPYSTQYDPANPAAAETAARSNKPGTLKEGIYTGDELIGEVQGRSGMGQGEGGGKQSMGMPMNGEMQNQGSMHHGVQQTTEEQ